MVKLRWVPVWRRNFHVWQKLLLPSIIGNFGEPLIYLLALGFGLGKFVGNIGGVSYVTFLASGIVCSSSMTTATFESMYSVYTRMAVQGTWDGMLNTPLTISDVVIGEMVWAGTKSLINASAILIVAAGLGLVNSWLAIFVLPIIFMIGCCFSAMALVVTSFAKSYDFFLYYFSLFITPMMLLSGVFFPIGAMPKTIQNLALLFPLSHAVMIIRPLMIGGSIQHIPLHLLVIVLYLVVACTLAIKLFHKRMLG